MPVDTRSEIFAIAKVQVFIRIKCNDKVRVL